ncbi:MAG: DUF3501 family protein [Microthrixaceae bacterium]
MGDRRLTLDDIADARAYEREREEFRARIIELKRRRRVHLGLFLTLVFENRDTIRFQIQEMARVERTVTDEGILTELAVYNPLIPEPGHLSATLFLELRTDDQMREWLPKLVGIERSLVLRFGGHEVRCIPEAGHEAQLTREEATAAVHYVAWSFTPEEVADWGTGPVELVCDHPDYLEAVSLGDATIGELRRDLGPDA